MRTTLEYELKSRQALKKKKQFHSCLYFFSMAMAFSIMVISILGFQSLDFVPSDLDITPTNDNDDPSRARAPQRDESQWETPMKLLMGCCCILSFSFFGLVLFLTAFESPVVLHLLRCCRFRLTRGLMCYASGIMALLLGTSFNRACGCRNFSILVILGAGLLVNGTLHLVAIFIFGNDALKYHHQRGLEERSGRHHEPLATPPSPPVMMPRMGSSVTSTSPSRKMPNQGHRRLSYIYDSEEDTSEDARSPDPRPAFDRYPQEQPRVFRSYYPQETPVNSTALPLWMRM